MWTRRTRPEGGHGFGGWLRRPSNVESVLFHRIRNGAHGDSSLGNKSGPGLFNGGFGPCYGHAPGFGGRFCAGDCIRPDVINGEFGPDGKGEAKRKCHEADNRRADGQKLLLFAASFAAAVQVSHAELGHPPTAPASWISGHDEGPEGQRDCQDGGNSNGGQKTGMGRL